VIPYFIKRSPNRGAIRYGQLAIDSQTNREKLPCDKREVRVQNVTEQELGANVYNNDSHVEAFYQSTL